MRTPEEQADFDLICAITEPLFARLEHAGTDALTQAERTVVVVWELEGEVNNGGFDQYFFNSSGDRAYDCADALRRIGANACAGIAARALRVFGASGPPRDRDRRVEQLQALDEAAIEELETLDNAFFEYPDNLEKLLAEYVRQHRNHFGS